ncbi:MAG: DNA polymerase III subunit chi [Motiliproteus sp.]|nr:DNA polymerase III subunit chi [Motiliproteus sp.]
MKRSDFYVLPSVETSQREQFLYKVVEKVLGLGHRIYIRAATELQAKELDGRLWDYAEHAFIPHSLLAEKISSPVEIGYGDSLPDHQDVYLNFALEVPESALGFDRTIEIVVQTDDVLTATRDNYRRYKEAGFEIHMNDMRPKP